MDKLRHKLERLEKDDLRVFIHNYKTQQGADADDMIHAAFDGNYYTKLESIKIKTTDNFPVGEMSHGLLKYLAISGNTALKSLTLSGKAVPNIKNYIRAIQQANCLSSLSLNCRNLPFEAIAELIRTTKSLTHLELCGNRFQVSTVNAIPTQEELSSLIDALARNTSLQSLELCLLDFSHDGSDPIEKIKASNSNISRLKLWNVNIYPGKLLKLFPNLQFLHHSGNSNKEEAKLLSSLVKKYPPKRRWQWPVLKGLAKKNDDDDETQTRLRSFYFYTHCHIGENESQEYTKLLQKSPDLQEFEISNGLRSRSDDDVFRRIGQGLHERTRMKYLGVASPVTTNNMNVLLKEFSARTTPLLIDHLSLEFQDETTLPNPLLRMLTHPTANCSLTKLTLDFGDLTNAICHELWMCLRQNTTLKKLVLKGHGFDRDIQCRAAFGSLNAGLSKIALEELTLDGSLWESLLGLKFLLAFSLDEEDKEEKGVQATRTMEVKTTLRKLIFSRMVFGTATINYCIRFISHPNCFLRHLSIYECRMKSDGIMDLLNALTAPTCKLEVFELTRDGSFSKVQAMVVALSLPKIAHLKHLVINGFNKTPFAHIGDIKQQFLENMKQNTSLYSFELDLEQDGFTFRSLIRFYGLRNQINDMLTSGEHHNAHETEDGKSAVAVTSIEQWLYLLAECLGGENACFAAAFYLLSKKLEIIMAAVE